MKKPQAGEKMDEEATREREKRDKETARGMNKPQEGEKRDKDIARGRED